MKLAEFPEFKHYAIIIFKSRYNNDFYPELYHEYIVLPDDKSLADWINIHGKSSNYRVIEAQPVTVSTSITIKPKGSR